MFTHHTKTKGDLGVLKVKLDLFEQEFLILNPETEHAPFDLAIYKDGIFKTVQVKYRSLNKRGALEVVFRNSHCDSTGTVFREVDKNHIDIYAVYCPDTDACYYFDPSKYRKSVTIRVKSAHNGQKEGIHLSDEFRKIDF